MCRVVRPANHRRHTECAYYFAGQQLTHGRHKCLEPLWRFRGFGTVEATMDFAESVFDAEERVDDVRIEVLSTAIQNDLPCVLVAEGLFVNSLRRECVVDIGESGDSTAER